MDMRNAAARVADLNFHLFERSVHPELFDILRRRDIQGEGYRAQLWITGPSHVVAFRAGGWTVSQVLAPTEAPLPRGGLRVEFPLLDSPEERVFIDGAIRYVGELSIERMDPNAYARRHRDLIASDGLDRIKYFFPEVPGSSLSPFAMMEFEAGGFFVEARAIHAYPAERSFIVCTCRFEVAGAPAEEGDGTLPLFE